MMAGRFEVYEDGAGTYCWRLRAAGDQIVATGEGYASQADAVEGIQSVRAVADDAEIYAEANPDTGTETRATKVNAASKLIKIEETGASLPD